MLFRSSGPVTLSGAVTQSGLVTQSGGAIATNATHIADATLTTGSCNSTQYVGTAGVDMTLPAPTAGCDITFVMTTAFATTNITILTAGGTDIIHGTLDVNAADVDCSSEDRVSFGASAEIVGDYFTLTSNGTSWYIVGSQGSAAGGITCDTR